MNKTAEPDSSAMNTFWKIAAGVLLAFLLLAAGIKIYFSDHRLKQTVMPEVNAAIGREVQVESMSLTFLSTFPHPGIRIRQMSIPGEAGIDTLMELEELVIGVRIFPLLYNEINLSELQIHRPAFTYKVLEDGSTNLDFLFEEEEADTTVESEGYTYDLPYISVSGGRFTYDDRASDTRAVLENLDAELTLRYDELIHSTVEIDLGGFSVWSGGTRYLDALPLSLSESSTIDLENEEIRLNSGTFSIRGLSLNLNGTIGRWSAEAPEVDLEFSSSSDDFGSLLQLAPAEYRDRLRELETDGLLAISGILRGPVGGERSPDFSVEISVKDGYLKNPELREPVRDIQLNATARNDLLSVETFEATAGSNFIRGGFQLNDPWQQYGAFSLELDSEVDLSTVQNFYPLQQHDIEQLGGTLILNATASGKMDRADNTLFKGAVTLSNGFVKYAGVSKPVERIEIDASGSQQRVTVDGIMLNAGQNRFSARGSIGHPLVDNQRTVDLTTALNFDLSTIRDFYPIDEDTLKLQGVLSASATMQGRADNLQGAIRSGSVHLDNGYIDYKRWRKPVEQLTLRSSLEGNRLSLATATVRSGGNNLEIKGSISDYLGSDPAVDLRIKGNARFDEIQHYYDLRPAIDRLTGNGTLDLGVKGPVRVPALLEFDGRLSVAEMNMEGDSLVQPVRDLHGELTLSPSSARLEGLAFEMGSSDIRLSGSIEHYMEYLKTKEERKFTPHLTGKMESGLLNLDELITSASDEPVPIELPDLTGSYTATIDTLIVTGVTMRRLDASAETNPTRIKLSRASVELFGGLARGSFTWDIPQPDRTRLSYNGTLTELNTAAFFREYQLLGPDSRFHEHVTGTFSADVEYGSELDLYLNPVLPTTRMSGTFSMTRSRIREHPLQVRLADLLKADELRSVALDESRTRFAIDNSVMQIDSLNLTSGDIGANMSGIRHLVNGNIDYRLRVFLPGRFRKGISTVLPAQALEALTRPNGTILLPLQVSGTHTEPRLQPDRDYIQSILRDILKKKAGDALKKLFGN